MRGVETHWQPEATAAQRPVVAPSHPSGRAGRQRQRLETGGRPELRAQPAPWEYDDRWLLGWQHHRLPGEVEGEAREDACYAEPAGPAPPSDVVGNPCGDCEHCHCCGQQPHQYPSRRRHTCRPRLRGTNCVTGPTVLSCLSSSHRRPEDKPLAASPASGLQPAAGKGVGQRCGEGQEPKAQCQERQGADREAEAAGKAAFHQRDSLVSSSTLEKKIEDLEKEVVKERQENLRLVRLMQDKKEMIRKIKEETDLLKRDLDDIEDENEQLKQENKTLLKVVGQLT
ncbi:hypothetical protein MC885_008212, partial [Smutsia gigantea]